MSFSVYKACYKSEKHLLPLINDKRNALVLLCMVALGY